jgi:serine/threonine protein phosphatase PrpC
MFSQRGRVAYAYEQSHGAISPEPPQQDRVRVEEIRTRGGLDLILAVVVDGEGHLRAGEAAETFIKQLFSGISQSINRNLNALLRDLLEEGSQSISRVNRSGEGIGEVAVTVVAVHRGRLFFAHAGHTMALLVREGKITQLTRSDDRLLGYSEAPLIQSGDPRGMRLQVGDRVMLASDGLTRISPEDGQPFVETDNVVTYVEGSTPLEAARHLISLAMGRDVDDNVSVVVIQVSGKRGGAPTSAIVRAGILLTFVLILGALGISRLRRNRSIPPPVDYGYAVLIQGSAGVLDEAWKKIEEMVGHLGTIPTGVKIASLVETRLALETTFEGLNELSGTSLFLDRDTRIYLALLDPHWDSSSADEIEGETLTVVDLLSGRIMVVRSKGNREIRITWKENTVALNGEGVGVLGVMEEGSNLVVDCLRGSCKSILSDGEAITLSGGQRATIVHGDKQEVEDLSGDAFQGWSEFCEGCLIDK